MAVFCTSEPPGDGLGRVIPYTRTFPYCVLLSSVALSLGALIVASTAVFTIHKAEAEWFRKVRHPSSLLGSQDDVQNLPTLSIHVALHPGV